MSGIRYRRGSSYAADMAVYARQIAGDNTKEVTRLRRNLVRAMQEEVTERQREMLLLYYGEGLKMRDIADHLGVSRPTVSRTILRGEQRLQRCLRYGAGTYLRSMDE